MFNVGDVISFRTELCKYKGIIKEIRNDYYSVVTDRLNICAVDITDKTIKFIKHVDDIHEYLKTCL